MARTETASKKPREDAKRRAKRGNRKKARTEDSAENKEAPVEIGRVPLRARLRVFRERTRLMALRSRAVALQMFRWALVLGVLGGLVWGYQLLEEHARTSETFTLRKVDLRGQSRLSREELLVWAQIHRESNIFERSNEAIEMRLMEHPWVRSAKVRRDLPDALIVEVAEHVPLALVVLDAPYLFSAQGVAFKVHELGDPSDLTVLTGVEQSRLREDPGYGEQIAQQVQLLFRAYRAAGLWRQEPIGEIHFEASGAMRLVVGQPAMEILLSDGLPQSGLSDLRRVIDDMKKERGLLAQVFVHEPGAAERRTGRGQRITVRYH